MYSNIRSCPFYDIRSSLLRTKPERELLQAKGNVEIFPSSVFWVSRVMDWGRHIWIQGKILIPWCRCCSSSRIKALISWSLPEWGIRLLPRYWTSTVTWIGARHPRLDNIEGNGILIPCPWIPQFIDTLPSSRSKPRTYQSLLSVLNTTLYIVQCTLYYIVHCNVHCTLHYTIYK